MVENRHTIDVEALGRTIRIEAAQLTEHVAAAWRDARSSGDVGGTGPDATVALRGTASSDQALSVLSTDVTLTALRHSRGEALLFHAAGIALDDGRVIGFVGPSGRGKTTLSAELGRYWGYVTDETVSVSLDSSRHVHPYRKPLSIIRGPGPKQQVAPSELGLRPVPELPLTLSKLVLLDRHTDDPESLADLPRLTAVPRIDAIVALASESSYLVALDAPLAHLAQLIDDTGGVLRMSYRDVNTVPTLIRSLAVSPSPAESGPLPPDAPATALAPWNIAPYGDRAGTDVRDALEIDGEILVLLGEKIHRLDGIGPLVWQQATQGSDTAAITASVVAAFGHPDDGDATEIVTALRTELRYRGLLA